MEYLFISGETFNVALQTKNGSLKNEVTALYVINVNNCDRNTYTTLHFIKELIGMSIMNLSCMMQKALLMLFSKSDMCYYVENFYCL